MPRQEESEPTKGKTMCTHSLEHVQQIPERPAATAPRHSARVAFGRYRDDVPRRSTATAVMRNTILSTLLLASSASCLADVAINNPQVGGYGLDYCREWATNCGWPAAHAFCRSKGYKDAATFKWKKDNQKTRILNGGQVCDAPFCDRISTVTCREATVTFANPQIGGYGLDYCREWAKDCGWPAAHAFCVVKGHPKAVDFKWVKDNQKTRIINGGQVCDAAFCDRISKVVCLS